MSKTSKMEWIRFGVNGFLLSIIGSAACGAAERLGPMMQDAFNILSPILLGVGVVLLIAGVTGAILTKNTE